MAVAATPLSVVLDNLDRLRPEEIDVVKKRLARANGSAQVFSSPQTLLNDKRFSLTYRKYLALTDKERAALKSLAYKEYRSWIFEQLDRMRARWMLIGGGKIIASSSSLKDYPTLKKMRALGKKHGVAPMVFVSNTIIEESSWTALVHDDFYPNLSLVIGGARWSEKKLLTQGLQLDADFDTGASDILLDYSQLLVKGIVSPQPFKPAQENYHLGRTYQFYLRQVKVAGVNAAGAGAF